MRGIAAFFLVFVLAGTLPAGAEAVPRRARIGDLVSIEGVRENPLVGYGLVVGLNGTGDRSQTVFTTQTLANILQRMGVQVPATAMRVNNAAAVLVTAKLPPFAAAGTRLDVTVSSIGDAKSLEGGMLILTSLSGPDGQIYAEAQGPLTLGGYSAGTGGNTRQVNHPTVGRIPMGALVERNVVVDLKNRAQLLLSLREMDFAQACAIADAINQEFQTGVAVALDGRQIQINPRATHLAYTEVLARIEDLRVTVRPLGKVVVNERTGTIVMGREVRLSAVSILHGNLSIEIVTDLQVSQPNPFSNGQTTVVPQTSVRATENQSRRIELLEGATVDELVNGLQVIGATARDVVAILQALKAAGALQAELEVI